MKKILSFVTFFSFFICMFIGCKKSPTENTVEVPEATTASVTEITDTTAQCGGTVTSDGGASVSTRGVCWSTEGTPTVADDTTNNGTGTGNFTSYITGLTANTTYYVRAYASNSEGTGYGNSVSFTTTMEYAGGTGTVNDPFLIETAEQLNRIGQDQSYWDKHFRQIADIDLSVYSGDEFNIIGIEANGGVNFPFTGTFDGNGYEIRNFTYESSERGVAIFECVDYPGELRNITMVNPSINCPQSSGVGALVFQLLNGIVDSCKVLGGTISGGSGVGGLVANYWTTDTPSPGAGTTKIINCHVTANVSGTSDDVGGLVGINHGLIQKCSSSGSVSGSANVGGLTYLNGYWASWNTLHGEISDCYSTCNVSGTSRVGGLVGQAGSSTTITNCYAIGEVTGTSEVGGLVGSGSLTVQSSFWDTVSSGISTSRGGTGLSTEEMQNPVTYENAGWDMINTWEMEGTSDYPKLKNE